MSDKKVDIDEMTKVFTAIENAFGDGDMFVVDLNDAVIEEKVIKVDIPKLETKKELDYVKN